MQNSLSEGVPQQRLALRRLTLIILLALACLPFMDQTGWAHAVTEGDKGYIQEISGIHFIPFMYLGAKHMITGYDHLLFLAGVVFFLYRMKHIAIYVTLFAIGHSTTMILGVYYNITMSSYIIDAIIGLSVVYKALDNMGAYQRWFGFQPNTKAATLIFGLFHGFGLATKVQEYEIASDGLLTNLIAFNIGVEVGQLLALAAILIAMSYWRRTDSFWRHAYTANVVMMTAGFVLTGMHLTGYFTTLNS
ncbi:MAG: HupE/UreJ family protein [Hoeflea sp.]|nr:HupE/UreJ family protein [Hoeflea sp.]